MGTSGTKKVCFLLLTSVVSFVHLRHFYDTLLVTHYTYVQCRVNDFVNILLLQLSCVSTVKFVRQTDIYSETSCRCFSTPCGVLMCCVQLRRSEIYVIALCHFYLCEWILILLIVFGILCTFKHIQ